MNSKLLKTLIGAVALALGVATVSAQSTPPTVVAAPTAPAGALGAQLRQIMTEHRATMQALLEQRKAALEAIKNAAPADREALKAALREVMRAQQQNQRELAKAIRDAIKARRDARPTPPPGG